ncbi:hypothetical protein Nepgr_002324 [Nepenthes gracilis]|uniref:Uncharacterized protein n=1 Tax=Nepenthes gracilis TaxID=150966 RepID=A0AAD3RYD5_NEPGR|nr:hypothetical protein Nepgr_002324 [Nepenthes gracilis]
MGSQEISAACTGNAVCATQKYAIVSSHLKKKAISSRSLSNFARRTPLQLKKEMSRLQDPHRPSFPFGNPFRMMLPKNSHLSHEHVALLNKFEETLAGRLRKLKPKGKDDILSLPWMKLSLQLLSETHNDIMSLITDLEFPVCDWEEKWINVYLDNSVKLLEILVIFTSELSRLSQGQLLLQCGLHNLDGTSSTKLMNSHTALDSWRQHIGLRNPRLENCCSIIDKLFRLLNLPKVKNSSKGKVVMRAMYGLKVETLFVCCVFTAAFTGSSEKLIDLPVPETHLWEEAFNDLQTSVNQEIRNSVTSGRSILVKELEAVDMSVKDLYPMLDHSSVEAEALRKTSAELRNRAEILSGELDILAMEVDGFFQIVLTGRDALLCSLTIGSNLPIPNYLKEYKAGKQLVR